MAGDPESPGMIGEPPSARGLLVIPADPGEHAVRFAREWQDVAERYVERRMRELGIPGDKRGASSPEHGIRWCTFNPNDIVDGDITTGITVDSGVLNPDLLKGNKGGRIWPKARLRDRIDAIIAHEWAEDQHGTHEAALKFAAKTELPVTDGAKRILRAMARKRTSTLHR
jgi:hypothetical protein